MKTYKTFTVIIASLLMLNMQCDVDDELIPSSSCEFEAVIDQNQFGELSPSPYTITAAEVVNGCLEITLSSSGCDGDTWEVSLFSDAPMFNGFETTASLSLKLVNPEVCLAVISQTYSFDISNIVDGNTNNTLELQGWPENLIIPN